MLKAEYITGLIDGEGSFTVYVNNGKNTERKRRTRIEPKFYIKLVEEDKDILYQLKQYFGCGNVYFQRDKRQNHKDCYRYEVTKREDLQKIIIPFFKTNPVKFATKQRDFKIFCEILVAISKNTHLTSSGLAELYRLKQKMH
jgi:stalled ribosome rescue protein Dom34